MNPLPAEVMDVVSADMAELNRRVPGFDGLVAPDIVLASVGLAISRANSASAARFDPELAESRIDDVMAWFDARRLPFVWRLGPADLPRDLGDRLVARGFVVDPDEIPGMVAPLDELPELELPSGATIEAVGDLPTFQAWLDVVVAGFEMPSIMGETFARYGGLGFGVGIPFAILGRLDGRPVAAALSAVGGGGVVITNVTTLPDARGRGLGRAMTLAAMRRGAAAGATIAVLMATEMGYGVYRKLGFEDFGTYRTLTWSRE